MSDQPPSGGPHSSSYWEARDGWTVADIERDRRYEERIRALEANTSDKFRASEIAVAAALQAAKESTTAAFVASEKAIIKAEDAQRAYNERSNEFRAALDDAAKIQISRTEANAHFTSVEEKIDELKKQIGDLREARRESVGQATQVAVHHQSNQWLVGAVIGGLGIGIGIISLAVAVALR